jgi:peptidoglycan hydrolase-like protein with peptidoglycan-binding domain
MNSPFTFETDEFEIPESTGADHSCGCAKCRAKRQREAHEADETGEDFEFEEALVDEVPLLRKGGAIVAAKARQVGATAKQSAASTRAGLTAEKTCWVQNVLNKAAGETLAADGIFGPRTRAAVMRFQSSHGLQVDGIVGKQTETALIQSGLNAVGQASRLPVNGLMDARTQQEIRRFQSELGLTVDGIVGPATRAAMVQALGGRCEKVTRSRPPLSVGQQWVQAGKPPCDRAEFDQQIRLCNEEAERCLKSALANLGLGAGGCLLAAAVGLAKGGVPGAVAGLALCGVPVTGTLLLALRNCDETLQRCTQLARQRTRCR